jgi:hypothetical protein
LGADSRMLARAGRIDSMAVLAEGADGVDAVPRQSGTAAATFCRDALGHGWHE